MGLKINLKQFEPKNTYTRNGSECYLDPFRQMLVQSTPQSLLLYKMEMYANRVMKVPRNMMYMSQSLRKYGVQSSKLMDIIIHDMVDGELRPIAIIECISPDRSLCQITTSHTEDLAKRLGVNCIIVTNGDDTDSYISRNDRMSYWKIDKIPNYESICNAYVEETVPEDDAETEAESAVSPSAETEGAGAGSADSETEPQIEPEIVVAEKPEAEIAKPKVKTVKKKSDKAVGFNAKTTPIPLQPVIMSLVNCLNDTKTLIKAQKYDQITIVGDCGLRRKYTGFGQEKLGNSFSRTFLIKDIYKNHQLIGFDISPDSAGIPVLTVTLDDFENRQSVINMNLNQCLSLDGTKMTLAYELKNSFPHQKVEVLQGFKKFISDKFPLKDDDDSIVFGHVGSLESIKFDDSDTVKLLVRVIVFSLLLDEFREKLKIATRERDVKKKSKK